MVLRLAKDEAAWIEVGLYATPRPEEARAMAVADLPWMEHDDEVTLIAIAARYWKPRTGRARVRREIEWS